MAAAPSRSESLPLPSERRFGAFFAAVSGIAAAYAALVHDAYAVAGALGLAAVAFAALALLRPLLLRPLNRAWAALGMLLGRIVSPIVLGAIFFLLLTPIAMITRRFGRDELRLRRQGADSYWLDRDPAGPAPESFRNQY
jgi:hypothetical protein